MKPLETLLDEVGLAVRKADFAALGALAPHLEAALAKVEAVRIGPAQLPDLARLKAKSAQNAALLDAARRGMQAARRRVSDAQGAARGLQTYDIRGRRSEIVTSVTTAGRF